MCILFCYVNPSPQRGTFKLVLVMNRDEKFDRPTRRASWENGTLCGRDGKASSGEGGGTWLGINEKGRMGCLTNLFTGKPFNKLSRGGLIVDYLKEKEVCPEAFMKTLSQNGDEYNPFNLLLLNQSYEGTYEAFYYSPGVEGHIQSDGPRSVSEPFIGLSNHPLRHPYRKTSLCLSKFKDIILKHNNSNKKTALRSALLEMMSSRESNYPDPQIEAQCLNESYLAIYKMLTSPFVQGPADMNYGTRTQTVITVDFEDKVDFHERNRESLSSFDAWETLDKEFNIRS